MTVLLKSLIEGSSLDGLSSLEGAEIESVRFYRNKKITELVLRCDRPLPFDDYKRLKEGISAITGCYSNIHIHSTKEEIDPTEIDKYINELCNQDTNFSLIQFATKNYTNGVLTFLYSDEMDADRAGSVLPELQLYLAGVGYKSIELHCDILKVDTPSIESVVSLPVKEKEVKQEHSAPKKKNFYHTKKENFPKIQLSEVTDMMNDIYIEADIFMIEEISIRATGRIIETFSVYDGTDAINVKAFEGRYFDQETLHSFKEGDRVRIYGSIQFDNFSRDIVLSATDIEKIEKEKVVDPAKEKRVELHMHSNMSEMDGVCEPQAIVKYAYNIGHEGICITDHADVQSFVKAFNTAQDCKKENPDRPFKVGLGCEFNVADDQLLIVRNPVGTSLEDATYVAFDLETTGLSCYFDSIIEFGAVRLQNNMVVDRLQMFIKPPHPIPGSITAKTHITNDMVKNAKSFAESIDEILDWIGDDVLVAHNATFDYFFLNEELRRIGREPLRNTIIDTLDMSRAILKERRVYRLGSVSRYYRVSYDDEVAHRADYDAEALAGVFLCLIKDAQKMGAETIGDLQTKIQDETSFKKVRKTHIVALCKNSLGLKALYELVSESSTTTLAVMGKASGKDGAEVTAEARVKRSSLTRSRENLLLGSSCLNNEVWELACNGDDIRLANAIRYYDYIEVQPPGNYATQVVLGSIPSMDRVREVIKRIITMSKKLHKIVVADSDAHYCSKDQKIFRDVYIMSQGVGGAAHPLYIRDEELRHRTKNPDQHIRFTDEMMQEFAFLEDEALIREIVIENPHKIFDSLEEVRPVPSGTFPPSIEGSDDLLRQICHDTEKRMYEFEGNIPEIVSTRLNEELDNIIRNGFGVHYYIAHLLVKASNDDGYVVGSRGSVGSSFTATMSGITEVNPLPPHYLCPNCHYSEWIDDISVKSGFDLEDKECPHCHSIMKGNGHNIPFQTFLGFNADKTPDIDLNFSNEYQANAHAFIKKQFGEKHAFRAGTIGTVAEKTAFGYVSGYCEKMGITNMRRPMKDYLAKHCQNVKRTTGQHPGGIIIIPENYSAEDFTPVQYPANDPNSAWKTTHYDFHDIHDNVLKFDILGHVDPTAMRLLQNISKTKPTSIPMNDPETLSLFYEDTALKADPRVYQRSTGALGLPEFGTRTTRKVLEETRPHKFSDLVIISGLSHGTDVWAGNAQELVRQGHPLDEVIGCRDDIMTYLLDMKLEPLDAFNIMEKVRKGKGVAENYEKTMREHNVPDWYIDSCKKIKYMFPKAHAVAYVMMAIRIAWYKVHEPWNFYIQFFSLRCDAYEIETMTQGLEAVRARMQDIETRQQNRNTENPVTNKEKALLTTLEVCEELYARGYSIGNVDLYKSQAKNFCVDENDTHVIIPPFTVIDGLGGSVAESVVEARKNGEFLSQEDIMKRTQLSSTHIKKLEKMGCLAGIQERNQLSLF